MGVIGFLLLESLGLQQRIEQVDEEEGRDDPGPDVVDHCDFSSQFVAAAHIGGADGKEHQSQYNIEHVHHGLNS